MEHNSNIYSLSNRTHHSWVRKMQRYQSMDFIEMMHQIYERTESLLLPQNPLPIISFLYRSHTWSTSTVSSCKVSSLFRASTGGKQQICVKTEPNDFEPTYWELHMHSSNCHLQLQFLDYIHIEHSCNHNQYLAGPENAEIHFAMNT